MDDALATVDAAFTALADAVGAANVLVAGFSQGACLALTWPQTTAHRPRQVVAMTGAHTPLPERDFSAARGARVRVSLSKGDKWVPQEAFDATVAVLEAAGADVTATTPLATGHRIHREDLDHLQAALAETLGETNLRALPGFGNAHQADALPGALPRRGNTPRQAKYRLVTEQINGTGFTVKRAENHRVWMYRLRPWILDRPWKRREGGRFVGDFSAGVPTPQVMRFRPLTMPSAPTDFLAGLTTFAGTGDMVDTAFANIDGDLLVVPEKGRLHVRTELGRLHVSPGELLVLPRGIRFQVLLPDGAARGWVAELMDGHFQLPERGPVGANGMADERHFLAPKPDFEDVTAPWMLVAKQGGQLWEQPADHSPFDVVAWHGSYAPFKYDLRNFGSLGNVQFDHVDPSVLTVLTSPMDTHGRNAIDVGVFLGRWDVTEGTFRLPYFHRNSAIEFNGVVANTADEGPWAPGAFTFTPYLTPHGIAAKSYERVVTATDEQADQPVRMPDESIWVQFESTYLLKVMPWMLDHPDRDPDYLSSFSGYAPGPELP
jgi:homogentisate 1,2-dioxygenase